MKRSILSLALVFGLNTPVMAQTAAAPPPVSTKPAYAPFVLNPNINEALVGHYSLPDPLTTLDGNAVKTARDWETVRRPEILKLYEENQFGRTPQGGPSVRTEAWEKAVPALGGKAKRTQVRLHIGNGENAPVIRVWTRAISPMIPAFRSGNMS